MPIGDQLAMAGINAITGGAMGILNDARQYKQEEELQALQMRNNMSMMDYSYAKQLQFWKDTNYSAQVSEMEKAGLNPALMYAKGGPGGSTGSPGAPTVTAGTAPKGGGEIQAQMQMGLQMQLIEAQKENIEADTAKKKAEATKTAGVDTQLGQATIQNLMQQTRNADVQEALLTLQVGYDEIRNSIQRQTMVDQMKNIEYTAKIAEQTYDKIQRDNSIGDATKQDMINTVHNEALITGLQVTLTNAQIGLTNEEIKKASQEIATMISQQNINWYNLTLEERKTMMTERLVKFNTAQSQRNYDNIMRAVNTVTNMIKPVSITVN